MFEAARVGDSIEHTSALAGFLIGALIGIALVAAASFVICSGGTGAFIIGTLMSFGGSLLPSLGEFIGKLFTHTTGKIVTGSVRVHINNRSAAYTGTIKGNPEGMRTAKGSEVACSEDPKSPPPQVAEGSTLVFIDSRPAARKDDKTECGASISEGSDNVHIGQEKYEYLPVQDEVPPWLRKVVDVAMFFAGFASGFVGAFRSGLKCIVPCLGKLAVSMGLTYLADKAIGAGINALVGNPVDTTTGRKVLKPEDETDFDLVGYLPFSWSRFYASNLDYNSMLGQGWFLPCEQHFYQQDGLLYYVDNQGRSVELERLKEGEQCYICSEQFFLLCSSGEHYAIQTLDGEFYYFGEVPNNGEKVYLQQIEDKLGHYIHFSYDDEAKLTDITTDSGQRLHLHYRHPKGKLTEVVRVIDNKPFETMVQYRYNEAGQLSAVINRNGDTTRLFDYQNGLMVRHQNGLGFISEYQWQTIDGQPRVIEHRTNDGEHYRFDYDFTNQVTTVTDALNRQAYYRYDKYHQLTSLQDFGGDNYQLTYDENGNLVGLTLPNGNLFTLKYDEYSRLIEETDPLARQVSYQYHQCTSLQTQVTLPDGTSYVMEYDDKDTLVRQTDALGQSTYYYQTEDGVPYAIVDAQQNRQTIKWNNLGQVTELTDCSAKTTHYHYNDHLQLSGLTDALGQTTLLERKPQGEITALIHPDGIKETFTYNVMGQLLSYADGKGQTRYLSRNPRGLVIKHFDAKDKTVCYHYDVAQRLTELLNEKNEAYQFSYDDHDRLIEETLIDQQRRRYHYKDDGNLDSITEYSSKLDPNSTIRTTQFKSDCVGRLTEKQTEDAIYQYQYDAQDRLLQIERKPTEKGISLGIMAETLSFAYDANGQLIQENTPHSKLAYQYDKLGNLTTLTLPNERQLHYHYYGSGHLLQIMLDKMLISDFERDDLHREILRSQGQLTSRFGYDAQGRRKWQYATHQPFSDVSTRNVPQPPIEHQLRSNNNLLARQYQYDPAGELCAILDSARGKTEYQYTENGQLQSMTRKTHHEYFTHDVAGNFLPGERLITPQFAPCNRIIEQDEIFLSYDQWGNVTEKAIGFYLTQRFAYDCENRLVSAHTYDSGKLIKEGLYAYDSLGRRIKKQSTDFTTGYTASTTFLWQGLRLLQEQNGNKRKLYIYEEDSYVPLARVDNYYQENDIYYYHTDQIGTPLELTNEQGEIVWRADYKAWGEINYLSINKVEQNLRYQGQYFDQETGLHYNTFRYYDPQLGRFTTQDPIRLFGGDNFYAYALNPTTWIDPLGWCNEFYRGSKPGKDVSFMPSPNEYKIDPLTGNVKTTHGVSVFDNAKSVASKGFTPNKIDMSTVSNKLQIIQRGIDPRHYEITPRIPMSVSEYTELLSRIKVLP